MEQFEGMLKNMTGRQEGVKKEIKLNICVASDSHNTDTHLI